MTPSEFENKWFENIKNNLLREFPNEFIVDSDIELLDLPGKPLIKGSELFGSYEVIDTDGSPFLTCDSLEKMKYVLYSNRNKPLSVNIPITDEAIISSVKNFENHLDEIVRMIREDYEITFPESDKFVAISNKIFQLLNLRRF